MSSPSTPPSSADPSSTTIASLGPCSTAFDVLEATKADLSGKTAVVTGGASGIGAVTSEALAKAGARVIIACRRVEEGEKVAAEIKSKGYKGSASVRKLDLADLSSVSAFAAAVSAEEPRIDLLINNAGVMACPPMQTKDGLELQIGTCHHGHFALTRALLPKLKATPQPPARVVTVASLAHRSGGLDPSDLHWKERPYGRVTAYGAAKLANVLFARELAKREGGGGGGEGNGGGGGGKDCKLLSFSLHPGVIHTPLFRHVVGEGHLASVLNPAMDWFGWGVRGVLTRVLGFPGVKTVEQGAATSVFAAVAPLGVVGKGSGGSSGSIIGGSGNSIPNGIPNGSYLSDCRLGETTPEGKDDALAAKLWEVTEKEVDAVLAKSGSSKE